MSKENEQTVSDPFEPVVMNDCERRGLPKELDLLLVVAESAIKEAKRDGQLTKRMELLDKLVNSVCEDFKVIMSKPS